MPANIVKTKSDERRWEEAKRQAQKQGKGSDYAYVMGIFQRMKTRAGSAKEAGYTEVMKTAGLHNRDIGREWENYGR